MRGLGNHALCPSGSEAAREDHSALPSWDLRDLYSSIDDPAIEADMDRCEQAAGHIESSCKGKMSAMSGDELAELITQYEELQERPRTRLQLCSAQSRSRPR